MNDDLSDEATSILSDKEESKNSNDQNQSNSFQIPKLMKQSQSEMPHSIDDNLDELAIFGKKYKTSFRLGDRGSAES